MKSNEKWWVKSPSAKFVFTFVFVQGRRETSARRGQHMGGRARWFDGGLTNVWSRDFVHGSTQWFLRLALPIGVLTIWELSFPEAPFNGALNWFRADVWEARSHAFQSCSSSQGFPGIESECLFVQVNKCLSICHPNSPARRHWAVWTLLLTLPVTDWLWLDFGKPPRV